MWGDGLMWVDLDAFLLPLPGSYWTYSYVMDNPAQFSRDHSTSVAVSLQQPAVPHDEKTKGFGSSTETNISADQGVPSSVLLCGLCDKSFISVSGLIKHKNRVHSLKRLPHVCNLCGKGYNYKEAYEGHMNMHNNIRAYKCPNCLKGWYYKTNLRDHIRLGGCKKKR